MYNPKLDTLERDGFGETLEIDQAHHLIHKGLVFYVADSVTLNSAASKTYVIITPDSSSYTHFLFQTTSSGAATIAFKESATLSNNGTTITAFNRNRNISEQGSVSIKHTPTITDAGTTIYSITIGSGQNGGGLVRQEDEFVLKKNTIYTYTVTSSAASNNINTVFHWYEREFAV